MASCSDELSWYLVTRFIYGFYSHELLEAITVSYQWTTTKWWRLLPLNHFYQHKRPSFSIFQDMTWDTSVNVFLLELKDLSELCLTAGGNISFVSAKTEHRPTNAKKKFEFLSAQQNFEMCTLDPFYYCTSRHWLNREQRTV